MCLSTVALTMFLALLPPEKVTMADDRVTVHADAGDVVWEKTGIGWCNDQPPNGREFM